MKKSQTTFNVSAGFQKAFVGSLVFLFTVTSAHTLYLWVSSYMDNPYVGGFQWWVASSIVLPILIFVLAWLFRPKQRTSLGKLFDSMLVTVVGVSFYQLSILLGSEIYIRNVPIGSGYGESVLFEASSAAVFVILYTASLLYLRSTRKWR